MDKYYIPELEEFHHGFEYERWLNSAYTPEKYNKEIFEFVDKDDIWDDDVTNMLAYSYSGGDGLRVKYLDREDIESLGWDTDDNGQCYNKTSGFTLYGLYPWEDINEYKITIEMDTVFLGIIKNKSELIKLLKQLNING